MLEVFSSFNHPVSITTKSDLVLRDLDFLIKGMFDEWLETHALYKRDHVLSLMRQSHEGVFINPNGKPA